MSDPLLSLVEARNSGKPRGITSVCSAHPVVVQAAARRAAATGSHVLIEATCNQVNQFGGYTGMTPTDFVSFVLRIAKGEGLDPRQIVFGGDHLGPNPWRRESAESAMSKAEAMVAAFVAAGFRKIHLDASMGCAGEPPALDDAATADRAARLAAVAERTARERGLPPPLFIIGTEVPVPGGADHAIAEVTPTAPEAARKTISVHRDVFKSRGLEAVLDRVIAVVVQPGVEFGSDNVIEYVPEKARALNEVLRGEPRLVFEAHSTDYQTRTGLAALVRDGYAILKVGPGLTFALREALYGLDLIASELVDGYGERTLHHTMERYMTEHPAEWSGHYHGSARSTYIQRHYSYSDRIRYYWGKSEPAEAVARLLSSLSGVDVPETLMRQFLPQTSLSLRNAPDKILVEAVDRVLADYESACLQNG